MTCSRPSGPTRAKPGRWRRPRRWWPARLRSSSELVRLQNAGDRAGIAALMAKAEDRAVTEDDRRQPGKGRCRGAKAAGDPPRRFRGQRARPAGDRSGGRGADRAACHRADAVDRRSSRELEESLTASKATNEALEAAVAERTEHLVQAHEDLRHSTEVMQSTFHSMAEAVLVIDTKGKVRARPTRPRNGCCATGRA